MSANFTIQELLHSNTADANNITEQYSPPQSVIDNLQALIDNVLQPLRDQIQKPIIVNCGYRCPEVNTLVGGVSNSQHLTGEAVDIHTDDNKALFEAIVNSGLPWDQCINEGKAEFIRLKGFLDNISPDLTLTELRMRSRWDMESLGQRAFEVIRDQAGRIIMFDHVPASTVRITKRDQKPTYVNLTAPDPDKPGQVIKREIPKYFRRYVQLNAVGKRIYFKEFGDPRIIDPHTGLVNKSLPVEEQATEIYYETLYMPGQIYGITRWSGCIPAILGSKEAELVNLNFFRDNAIPAMAVMVSNGALTSDSFDKLSEYFLAIKGQKSMNRVILLEATADDAGGSTDHSQPAPKITMQPLISERQQEGLFQGYDQNNQQKIRSSFRLPPIYVGRAEDYTRASAVASMLIAENQVFAPERAAFDFVMNDKVLSTHKPKYWKFKSKGAPITDAESLTSIIDTMGNQGALTPNAVIKLANQFLNISIAPITEQWGDVPFAAVKAMLVNGDVIKGLDKFLIGVGKPLSEPEPADPADAAAQSAAQAGTNPQKSPATNNKNDAFAKAAKQFIRGELRSVLQDLVEETHKSAGSTLQTSAKGRKKPRKSENPNNNGDPVGNEDDDRNERWADKPEV